MPDTLAYMEYLKLAEPDTAKVEELLQNFFKRFKNAQADVCLLTKLIKVYLDSNREEDAQRWLDFMERNGPSPNNFTYNAWITYHLERENYSKAREIKDRFVTIVHLFRNLF